MAFWEDKPLAQMSREEWESLCDGCGRCCLHKLRDEETDAIDYTSVACRLLDTETCRCGNYVNRRRSVPDCVRLTPSLVEEIDWLPPSCAYRLIDEGKRLAWWHPLVSGRPETVHEAGVSVRGRVIGEREAGPIADYITAWPNRMPRTKRGTPPC